MQALCLDSGPALACAAQAPLGLCNPCTRSMAWRLLVPVCQVQESCRDPCHSVIPPLPICQLNTFKHLRWHAPCIMHTPCQVSRANVAPCKRRAMTFCHLQVLCQCQLGKHARTVPAKMSLQDSCQCQTVTHARSMPGFPLQEPGQNRRGPRSLPQNPKFSRYWGASNRDSDSRIALAILLPSKPEKGKDSFHLACRGVTLILVGPLGLAESRRLACVSNPTNLDKSTKYQLLTTLAELSKCLKFSSDSTRI